MPAADHSPSERPRPRHRPAWIVVVVLGAIVCLGMGYWQLTRYNSAGGTAQNLGYTFMWPFLAGFLVYAYLRYIRLEAEQQAELAAARREPDPAGTTSGPPTDEDLDDDAGPGAGETDTPTRPRWSTRRATTRPVTEIPAGILPTPARATSPDGGDPTLRAYNDYLAELARADAGADSGPGDDGDEPRRPTSDTRRHTRT